MAVEAHHALVGVDGAEQHEQRGGLAGPVGPDEADPLAGLHGQRHAVDGARRPERLDDVDRLDDGLPCGQCGRTVERLVAVRGLRGERPVLRGPEPTQRCRWVRTGRSSAPDGPKEPIVIAESRDRRRAGLTSVPAAGRRPTNAVPNRARTSPQRLRVPADLSAAAVGVLLAGAAPANLAYAVLLMATLVRLGTYRKHLHLSVLTELPRLVLPTAFPLGLLAPLSPWIDLPTSCTRRR